MPSFSELLEDRGVLLADGASATNYQDMGIEPGVAPEEWVFDAPHRVGDLHRRFAEAGCDLVLTCTFGASAVRLEDGPLAGLTRELNVRAAEIAREAVGEEILGGRIGRPHGLALDEALWAAEAIRTVTDLPLVMAFSFDRGRER